MKELRARITLDEAGFLASAGRVEAAVARLGKQGLASSFVNSFKQLGSKGTFAGMLDGLESAVRGMNQLKQARAGLAAAEAKHFQTQGYLKQAAAELRGKIATPKSGLLTPGDAVEKIKPIAAELGKVKQRILELNNTRLELRHARARRTAADKAYDDAIASVNAGRHPVTNRLLGNLSLTRMAALVRPFQKALQEAEKDVAKLDTTLSALGKARYAFAQLKTSLVSVTQALRGKTGTDIVSPDEARAKMRPLADAAKSSGAAVKIALQDVGKAALASVVGIASAVFGVVRFVGGILAGIVRTIASVVSAALSAIGSLVGAILSTVTKLAGVLGAIALTLGGVLVAGIKKAVDLGRELVNTQAQTGLKPRSSVVLRSALGMAGINQSHLDTETNRLQTAISGVGPPKTDTLQAIHALGLRLVELRKMSPEQLLEAVGTGLQKLANPADRAAAAIKLFTVRGNEMLGMLMQTHLFQTAREQWGKATELLAKNADKFAFVSRAIDGLLHVKPTAFFTGVASGLGNALTFFADKLNKLDFTELGVKVGEKLKYAVEVLYGAFQKGQLWELAKAGMIAAFTTAGDYLIGILSAAAGTLQSLLGDAKFLDALTTAILSIKDLLIYAFQSAAPVLAKILGQAVGAAMGLWDVHKINQQRDEALNDPRRNLTKMQKFYEDKIASTTEHPELYANPQSQRAEAREHLANVVSEIAAVNAKYDKLAAEAIGPKANQYGATAEKLAKDIVGTPQDAVAKQAFQALVKAGEQAGPRMVAAIQAAFKNFKPSDLLDHGKWSKEFTDLAAKLKVDLPDVPVPQAADGGAALDPWLKWYPRPFEAGSDLEKKGARFDRRRAPYYGVTRSVSPMQQPESFAGWAHPKSLADAQAAWSKVLAGTLPLADYRKNYAPAIGPGQTRLTTASAAGMTPQRDPANQMNRVAQNTANINNTLRAGIKVTVTNPAGPAVVGR